MSRIRVVRGVPTGEVSPARYTWKLSRDVLAPMRDGVMLAMDVLKPDAAGPFPVVLIRTPYDKVALFHSSQSRPFLEDLARRGYVVAIQDCRGRYNSDGAFDPYRQEHADGFDTVEWLAAQPWCDGNVGMMGRSYVGQTPWFAASQAPKALKAIVPIASPPGHAFLNEPFWGGVLLLAMSEWLCAMGRRCTQFPGMPGLFTQEQPYFEPLPTARIAAASGTSSPWWNAWTSHPTYDDYWHSCGYEQFWPRMTVPALNVTGWWDMNFPGAPRNFAGMRESGGTREARDGQRLVIGPWPHWVNLHRTLSGLDFGPDAVTELDTYTIRFFDRWLRSSSGVQLDDDARVHVFVIGANQWWEAEEWPLPGTAPTPFYLHSGGRANTHHGDGTLAIVAPADEPSDSYSSDPLDPVRVGWNLHEGPVDDRPVSARPDVLCYTSAVLERAVDVVGPVKAVLYASSSARDCDWHIRLVDVHPEGVARFLCHGVLRARFRKGFETVEWLTPDLVERFDIDMTATGVRFLPGHRIRVEIASTWFSRFERNPQTDAPNWMTSEVPPVKAHQRVHHSATYPSHVSLPLIVAPPTT